MHQLDGGWQADEAPRENLSCHHTPALPNNAGAPLPRQGLKGPKGAKPWLSIGSVVMVTGSTGAARLYGLYSVTAQ